MASNGERDRSSATRRRRHARPRPHVPVRAPGYAVQVARPLTEVDQSLAPDRALPAPDRAAGWHRGGARAARLRGRLAPVQRLTERDASTSPQTGDLSERIDVAGDDELCRLAASFNTMLAALEESTRAQRQLVADASHELRTPLTSLRTNIEVLAGDRALPPEERKRLLSRRRRAARGDDDAGRGARRARARRAASRPSPRTSASTSSSTRRSSGRGETAGPRRSTPTSSESIVHGVPSTLERAVTTSSTTRRSGARAGGEVEVEVRGRRGGRPRPRARDRRRGPPVRLRPLLPGARRARACRARASDWRSSGRSRRLTAARSWPSTPRGRGHGWCCTSAGRRRRVLVDFLPPHGAFRACWFSLRACSLRHLHARGASPSSRAHDPHRTRARPRCRVLS